MGSGKKMLYCINKTPEESLIQDIYSSTINSFEWGHIVDDLNCITEHEIFIANCLNRHVLQVSMYAYMEHVGPFDDNEPINEKYRFMAYRRFVQWIWHRLGRHNRKILPACVVKKIRDSFPSEEYCGFKYAVV
ncbi:P2X purinoceptor 7-like [Mytilus californianus]|uniref:P2X purinoceptor 7-like n=1 Tax=Mytilus californianus TaxID=6549 RepID=UPI002245E464|nr:P2X purinoceptor 7-like [Mytilus californianus]